MRYSGRHHKRSLKKPNKCLNPPYVIQHTYNWGETDSLIYPWVIPYSMEEEDKIVAIKVTLKTREKLKRFGLKGDTYEDVITKMFVYLPAEQPTEGLQQ